MKKIFYLLAFFFLLNSYSKAQQIISVKSNFITSQLPSASVPRIFQDKDGFMWFGTLDGLCRYDGYQLLIFRSDSNNPGLLVNNEITCIAEDSTNHLWIGTKKGVDILNKATYEIYHLDKAELRGQDIKHIYVASDGNIWVGTSNRLYRYNRDFSLYRNYDKKLPNTNVNSIYEDKKGNIWVMLWGSGLFKYIPYKDEFEKMPSVGELDNPFKMYQDNKDNYWIGTWGDGLYRFDPSAEGTKMYTSYPIKKHESQIKENHVFSIVQDDEYEYIWLISSSGLYTLQYSGSNIDEIEDVDVFHLFKDKEPNNIYSEIIKDKNGSLWIGTFSEGVFTINFDQTVIKNYAISSIKKQIGITTNITALYEDADGDIWLNQNRWGFGFYNPQTDNIYFYQEYSALKDIGGMRYVLCISGFRSDPGSVWVGLENEPVIYVLDKDKNKNDVTVRRQYNLNQFAENPGNLRKFHEDRQDNIWIVTSNGLLLKPYGQDIIMPISFSLGEITDITEDTRGNIWVSSKNSGLYEIPFSNNTPVDESSVRNYTKENSPLKSNNTSAVYADTKGKVWIGTKEGTIMVHDIVNSNFRDITSTFSMIDEGILNITSDLYGHIWVSTNKRIVEFNPQNSAIKEYVSTDDDILVNSFLVNSYCKNKKGQLLYAGNRGISVFTPSEKLSEQAQEPIVYVTDVKINNRSVFTNNANQWLNLSTSNLIFEPGDKNIEIGFSALNYVDPHKTRYAYKLEGIDDDWVYTSGYRQFAVYNQLKKGYYAFRVKAMDSNGLWSDEITTLQIYKQPAFYETWWAYLIYFISVLLIIRSIYVRGKNRIRLQNDLQIAQIEKEKSEELTQTKLRYFTNISHDFLTPLTILSCLIDDAEITYKDKISQFDAMRSNINRLRRLLQQVLDFRKVESGNMKLKITNGDIVMFIRDVCYTNFLPLMKKKNIEFSFNSTPSHIQAWFDADKIDKIVFNLLSNAFKYTPENGKVSITLNKYRTDDYSHLTIKVHDSGIGISEDNLSKIFTRFYSNKTNEAGESNGIGLNLTKDLVEIHRGMIQIDSKEGEGSLFIVDIPIDKEAYESVNKEKDVITYGKSEDILSSESSIGEDFSNLESPNSDNNDSIRILLIEDNEELLFLMKNILSKHYNVLISKNGLDALPLIKTNDIDIIISDVMMPEMDGLELCRILKKDIETSHIPIILLTAKNSAEDRIECYNAGADGYISKPFELKVLEARINNFISRKKAKQYEFQADKEINISTLEYPSMDENFLTDTVKIIEKYLSDSNFDVNMLAQTLYLSKSTLYRKIKTMTGLSPVEFIRNIRLKHACQILDGQSIAVSEVAYMVGFSDPKYFTSCFKAEFGITPKDYKKR